MFSLSTDILLEDSYLHQLKPGPEDLAKWAGGDMYKGGSSYKESLIILLLSNMFWESVWPRCPYLF